MLEKKKNYLDRKHKRRKRLTENKLITILKMVIGSLLLFNCSDVSDSVIPWGAACQASPSFTISWSCSNSCPLHQGCHYCCLTCIQISQETGKVVWYSHLFKNFPQLVTHTVKGFSVVNEAEVDVFLKFSCFFYGPVDVGNLISGSSAFSKYSSNIWKFTVHILLKPGLQNFEHYFTSL